MKLYPEYNDNQMVVAYYRYSSSSQNEASIEQQRKMVSVGTLLGPDCRERVQGRGEDQHQRG